MLVATLPIVISHYMLCESSGSVMDVISNSYIVMLRPHSIESILHGYCPLFRKFIDACGLIDYSFDQRLM